MLLESTLELLPVVELHADPIVSRPSRHLERGSGYPGCNPLTRVWQKHSDTLLRPQTLSGDDLGAPF